MTRVAAAISANGQLCGSHLPAGPAFRPADQNDDDPEAETDGLDVDARGAGCMVGGQDTGTS